ncbi:unnamed protein product [Linum trigynum]|uniref:Uncharacterized protein n=1 Tax=Linum trigynum TaxID=586398 RepID=A0AAV2DCN7_9ROSI
MDARVPDRDRPDDDNSPATSESSSDIGDGGAGFRTWIASRGRGQKQEPDQRDQIQFAGGSVQLCFCR